MYRLEFVLHSRKILTFLGLRWISFSPAGTFLSPDVPMSESGPLGLNQDSGPDRACTPLSGRMSASIASLLPSHFINLTLVDRSY